MIEAITNIAWLIVSMGWLAVTFFALASAKSIRGSIKGLCKLAEAFSDDLNQAGVEGLSEYSGPSVTIEYSDNPEFERFMKTERGWEDLDEIEGEEPVKSERVLN